jgi:acetyltransferase-like isoleucine patch superfamily enzyme
MHIELPPLRQRVRASIKYRLVRGPLGRMAREANEVNLYITGRHAAQCVIHPTASTVNLTINAASGIVRIGEYAMFGHGVRLLTGTHDVNETGQRRQTAVPEWGRDIVVEPGAWVATGAIVIGPAIIGANSIVAAGSVVIGDVPPDTVVAGAPAKVIRHIVPADDSV